MSVNVWDFLPPPPALVSTCQLEEPPMCWRQILLSPPVHRCSFKHPEIIRKLKNIGLKLVKQVKNYSDPVNENTYKISWKDRKELRSVKFQDYLFCLFWRLLFWMSRSSLRILLKKVFLKISQYSWESTCVGISFGVSFRPANLLKRDTNTCLTLWNFLRTYILRNICKGLLLDDT